jgi:hypothetical protein
MPILGYFLVIGASLVDIFKLFPRVEERLEQAARLLSGGEQQYMGPATTTLWNNLATARKSARVSGKVSCLVDHWGLGSPNGDGLARPSIVAARCKLGSAVGMLAPKRARYIWRFSITRCT